jgi:hypothetical protein
MLIIRGLTVAFSGFAFIFLPGIIVSLLTRRGLRFDAKLLLWGMAVLVVTLFPAYFITILLRLMIFGESMPQSAIQYAFVFLASLITALFLEGGKYLLLRMLKVSIPELPVSGIWVGLGVGLLTNVFQGISLVGAGFRLVLGDTSMPDLAKIAAQVWGDLLVNLVFLNIYRIVLVAVGAMLGWFVAQTLVNGQKRWFWLAVCINTVTAWSYSAIGLALQKQTLTANIVNSIYQAILAALALYWLIRQISRVAQPPVAQDVGDK